MDFPAGVMNVIAMKHETNCFNGLHLDLMVIFLRTPASFIS